MISSQRKLNIGYWPISPVRFSLVMWWLSKRMGGGLDACSASSPMEMWRCLSMENHIPSQWMVLHFKALLMVHAIIAIVSSVKQTPLGAPSPNYPSAAVVRKCSTVVWIVKKQIGNRTRNRAANNILPFFTFNSAISVFNVSYRFSFFCLR